MKPIPKIIDNIIGYFLNFNIKKKTSQKRLPVSVNIVKNRNFERIFLLKKNIIAEKIPKWEGSIKNNLSRIGISLLSTSRGAYFDHKKESSITIKLKSAKHTVERIIINTSASSF